MERGGGPSAGPLVPAHTRRRPPGPSPASPRPASRLPAWSPPSPLTLSRVPPGPGGPTCRCHVPDSLAGDPLTARTPGTRRLPVRLCSQPLRTAATSPHPCKSSPWESVVFYSGRLDRTNPGSGVPQGRATGARRAGGPGWPAGTAQASGFCEPRLPSRPLHHVAAPVAATHAVSCSTDKPGAAGPSREESVGGRVLPGTQTRLRCVFPLIMRKEAGKQHANIFDSGKIFKTHEARESRPRRRLSRKRS